MNISKREQRVLHVSAQGGSIRYDRAPNGKLRAVACTTRDGAVLTDCTRDLALRLKGRGFIHSSGGRPYRATPAGIAATRAQADNR